jgi:hypothetical protein
MEICISVYLGGIISGLRKAILSLSINLWSGFSSNN